LSQPCCRFCKQERQTVVFCHDLPLLRRVTRIS
jgi:hypothetical protein